MFFGNPLFLRQARCYLDCRKGTKKQGGFSNRGAGFQKGTGEGVGDPAFSLPLLFGPKLQSPQGQVGPSVFRVVGIKKRGSCFSIGDVFAAQIEKGSVNGDNVAL